MTRLQERLVHKLAFRQSKREKGETLVDLATNLRRLAARVYPGKDPLFIEDEIVNQFISALDSRELRIRVSQTNPSGLDDAISTALRLEGLHGIESKHRDARINMADIVQSEMTTAGVDTVRARYDGTIPGWAKHYLERQQGGNFQNMTPPAPSNQENTSQPNEPKYISSARWGVQYFSSVR